MYDTLSAMMGALVCIFFIAVVVCLVVISKLLTKNRDDKAFIDTLRRENSDLWHQVHTPFLPKEKKIDIEDEM